MKHGHINHPQPGRLRPGQRPDPLMRKGNATQSPIAPPPLEGAFAPTRGRAMTPWLFTAAKPGGN